MRDWMLPLIFSAVIVVIQVVFAPILTVFSTVPSFIVSFVLVLSIMRRPDTTYVYAFVLGLIAHTPVGLPPLLLLIAVFCLSRVFEVLDGTSLAMPIIALAATLLVFELLFAIVLMVLGYQGSIFEILAQRVIPATILNSLIAALLFVVMRRLPFAQPSNEAWQVPTSGRFR